MRLITVRAHPGLALAATLVKFNFSLGFIEVVTKFSKEKLTRRLFFLLRYFQFFVHFFSML